MTANTSIITKVSVWADPKSGKPDFLYKNKLSCHLFGWLATLFVYILSEFLSALGALSMAACIQSVATTACCSRS